MIQRDIKGATNYIFLFDSWFSPNRLAEDMVDFVADMVGMVKTNIKGFCKDIIENTKKLLVRRFLPCVEEKVNSDQG